MDESVEPGTAELSSHLPAGDDDHKVPGPDLEVIKKASAETVNLSHGDCLHSCCETSLISVIIA